MNSILEELGRKPKMLFEKTHPNAILPFKTYPQDAGWDVFSIEDVIIPAKGCSKVNIGIRLAYLDLGYWFKIESRSGLAFKHDIMAFQGVIDNNYRGEIGIKLFNFSDSDYQIKTGDRVAQIVIYMENIDFNVGWGRIVETDRGNKGFGSTGN